MKKKFKSKRVVRQNRGASKAPPAVVAHPHSTRTRLGAQGLRSVTVRSGGRMTLSDPVPPVRHEIVPLRNAAEIEVLYATRCQVKDSINEHLPTLRALASECDDVIEFGVKIARSSAALLLGARGHVYSYDVVPRQEAHHLQKLAGDKWRYKIQDSRTATPHACDMLFIDSLHTYAQLKAEIDHAAHLARRYIVFHDTVTFGRRDADGESGKTLLGTRGIWPAIKELMEHDKTWKIERHYENNNGLLVLKRDLSACLVAYTAAFGVTDALKDPTTVNPYCRYICFSDRPQASKVWETWEMPLLYSPIKQARCVKILGPDNYLGDYGFSLWLDASFHLQADPVALGLKLFGDGTEIAMFKHPDRATIEQEADEVVRLCGIPRDAVQAQVQRYRGEGFPRNTGLSTTGLLFRRHTDRILEFNQVWWKEIERGTVRDQISVDYAAWKTGVQLKHIPGTYRKNEFVRFMK